MLTSGLFLDFNLIPDCETAALCDEPLAAADHLVCDLHQQRGNPLRRVVEARHLIVSSCDIIRSNLSDLVDHLHDLEELHQRLVHLVGVLKIQMPPPALGSGGEKSKPGGRCSG